MRLSQLYAELKTHDVEELNAKKRKVDGYDESGDIEAAVRKKFIGKLHSRVWAGFGKCLSQIAVSKFLPIQIDLLIYFQSLHTNSLLSNMILN